MKNIYIKINDLEEYDRNLLFNYTTRDLISIDDLLSIIDELQDDKRRLEEQIEEMKEPIDYEDDYSNRFDYSEWKANQE